MRRALLLIVLPLLAVAGTVTRTIAFDARDLAVSKANGYDVVQLSDFVTTRELGAPMMPEAVYHVLVPAGATVTDVQVTALEAKEIPGTYRIHPCQMPRPVSSTEAPEFIPPDPAVYSSNQAYPATLVDWGRTGTKSEFRLCGFMLHPLTYVPATGKLSLYRRMKVVVTYKEGDVTPKPMTRSQLDLFGADVASLVLNPEDVSRFAPPMRDSDTPDVDYAIITTAALSSYYSPLVEWRTKKGYFTQVFTTEWIAPNYPTGRDLQEKTRLFIIDYYTNHGLKYVLLAGDHAQVPARLCRGNGPPYIEDIPADVYYADLQWTYDDNRNNIFGEDDSDRVDLYHDVFVGRAACDNATQIGAFIAKTLYYEKTPATDYLKRMLLPYVRLNLEEDYSGKVVCDSIAAQTPTGWTDTYIANPTTPTAMSNAINQGYHFCHVASHGLWDGFYPETGSAFYTTSNASAQTNSTRPVIVNSIACFAGEFDYFDCVAEALMNNPNGGAVACIMNSRYGFSSPVPSLNCSEAQCNEFYRFYFSYDTTELGALHARSKEVYAPLALNGYYERWCYWALNLFGDPALPLWTDVPVSMTASHASSIQTGVQSFDVTVTSGGNPVQNALVCCYKASEVHAKGRTDAAGQVSISINPLTTGTMYLTVTGTNKLPVEHTVTVVALPGAFSLQTPADNAVDVSTSGSLGWQAASGATNYDVYLGTTSPPPLYAANIGNVISCPYTGLSNSTLYHWAVVAKNAVGSTRCSSDFRFTTIVAAPGPFVLVAPVDSATNQPISGSLSWNASANATSYDAYLGTYSPPPFVGNVATQFYNYGPLANNTLYYWTVVAKNAGGNTPTSSGVWNFTTVYHDVGATAIVAPTGIVDSGMAVTPVCSLDNFGTTTESYSVRMKIGFGYEDTAWVAYHAPNTRVRLSFDTWRPLLRGSHAVVCSTELGMDNRPSNDRQTGAVTVRVVDVASLEVSSPRDSAVYGTQLRPVTRVANYGTASATFTATMRVGAWFDTRSRTLASGASDSVTFSQWTADSLGTLATCCSVYVAGDVNPANDVSRDSVIVWYQVGFASGEVSTGLPVGFCLTAVQPNPMHNRLEVMYSVGTDCRGQVTVYDAGGLLVRRLVDGQLPVGKHVTMWDRHDERGRRVASGVYFCRMAAGEYREARKVLLAE